MNIVYFFIGLIYLFSVIIILNLIFKEKRSIQSTIIWIITLIFVPGIGLLFYVFIGRTLKNKNMFYLTEKEKLKFEGTINSSEKVCEIDEEEILYKNKDIINTFLNLHSSVLTGKNKVDIYSKPEEMFNSMLDELKKAKKFINMQYYILRNDDIGKKVIDILSEKAKEGIEVRLLYDGIGSKKFKKKYLKQFKENGGKAAIFFPSLVKFINLNINYRNHRKVVIIDGKIAFLGGSNVGDEYLGKNKKLGNWRDTDIRIKGQSVNTLNLRFLMDWRYASKERVDLSKYLIDKKFAGNGNVYTQIVSSGPNLKTEDIKYGYIKMIQSAHEYVYIQSPYFILDEGVLDIVKIACLSGVDVRIMIPSKPDHLFVYWATYSCIGELLKYGARVYLYDKNSFMHSKVIIVDDNVSTVGTANMDLRSFKLNFEVSAFMYSYDIAKKQKQIFKEDMKNSSELTLRMYKDRGIFIKFKESISRLLAPIL